MPFCPNCRDEFRDEIEVCPDCGLELVGQRPHEVIYKSLPERLVTVADFYFSPLAYLGKAKLESEGVRSFIFDEYIINVTWFYLIAIGGVKLKVSEEDASEAIRILKESRDIDPEITILPEEGCPKCSFLNIRYDIFLIYGLLIF
jgi:hypothetical protein